MGDIRHELHVLISIAKVDAAINAARTELALLPREVEQLDRAIQEIETREALARDEYDRLLKERRALEKLLEDNAEKTKKYRIQLMEVKTNKEYTAMLHEIEHMKGDTDAKEERLLILMDQLEQQNAQKETLAAEAGLKKAELNARRAKFDERIQTLRSETATLEEGKPKLLRELDPQIEKRYDRLLTKLQDIAVTHIVESTCQGCFTRVPPQVVVEVTKNEKLITCEACGRILVYYIT